MRPALGNLHPRHYQHVSFILLPSLAVGHGFYPVHVLTFSLSVLHAITAAFHEVRDTYKSHHRKGSDGSAMTGPDGARPGYREGYA
jgi:hypothetical protein